MIRRVQGASDPQCPPWQLIVQRKQRQWTPEDVGWCCKRPLPFVHPPFWLSMASAHLCFKVFFGPRPDSAWAPGSCNRCWLGSCPSPMPDGNWWIIPACFSSFTLQVGLLSGGCPSLPPPVPQQDYAATAHSGELLNEAPSAGCFPLPAAATAKSLQSCPTLCDPRDGSPPGSPVPGILQARTLEWVAISFSDAWKWKVKVKSLSRVQLLVTPWTAAYQAPPSMGFSRQEYWSGVPLPSPYNIFLFNF